ncbi:sensor histidine kinase [Dyadobacter bucti]|uniref:sensor histidine kinase n=1 Tax=Dyadobacter bucti TaxID=2572203 RepID=UPI003F729A40
MFKTKNFWILHLLGWLLFISLPFTIMSREAEQGRQVAVLTSGSFWLFFLIYFALFYVNLRFLIPGLFLKQRHWIYAGIFVTGFVVFYFTQPFENLIFKKFRNQEFDHPQRLHSPPDHSFERMPPPHRPGPRRQTAPVDFVSLVLFVIIWVVAMAIRISEQWRLSERKAILSEADKAQAELSFFKAQINPHFLFNTLNNIYSLAVSKHDNTAPSILKLSKMMRYITEEATENYVPLEDEIACLKNYIDLQRLRLNEKTKVDVELKIADPDTAVAPLIMMTFVENAFKFGVSNHRDSLIRICIESTAEMISFFCENMIIDQGTIENGSGVGIANTKKRLDFLYAGRYEFKIENNEKTFVVHLKLFSK